MRIVILSLILFHAFFGVSQSEIISTEHPANGAFFNSCSSSIDIIHHKNFSLLYNEKAEQPEWVAYRLTSANFSSDIERTNDYREDTLIENGSASLEDYIGSGYDRGHLAPAASMKNGELSMSESFLMSNISPQLPGFNRGIWKRLEEKVRYWADNHDSILVVSGPILDEPIETIGPNEVAVPKAFYKLLIKYKNNTAQGIAFMIPHEPSKKSLYSFATSIDAIEELTGVDFFCKLEKSNLDRIEKNSSIKVFLFGESK